jgi:hypothetical protein
MSDMTMPDHDAERARLARVYAAMSKEELKAVAESGDELSLSRSGSAAGGGLEARLHADAYSATQ